MGRPVCPKKCVWQSSCTFCDNNVVLVPVQAREESGGCAARPRVLLPPLRAAMGKNKPKKKGLKEEEARIRADSALMRTSFLEQVRTPLPLQQGS